MAASSAARRVAFCALGCRVGRSDLEALAAALGPRFTRVAPGESADWVVVSACAVTADAASASRQAVRRAGREHPRARIVVAGCQAQGDAEALAALPGVAAVVGARDHAALPGVVARLEAGEDGREAVSAARAAAPSWTSAPAAGAGPARPVLKVQDGCDGRCSYCAVPAARGRSRSLPFDEALRRIASLGSGRAEVVLSGIHLGAYGRDLVPPSSLRDLLDGAAARRAVRRIRLSSVDPSELPLELLSEAGGAILCRHLHLPLQSGSDAVLAAMRRPLGAAAFARVVEAAARAWPGVCLGADVMAGFPGETGADHGRTISLLRSLPLAYLHVFAFSPRAGTPAAALPGRPPPGAVRDRAEELREFSRARWDGFLEDQVGRVAEVVVERVGRAQGEPFALGTSSEYAPVRFPSERARRGALARVRVVAARDGLCIGAEEGAPGRARHPAALADP
ncbi:MAG TPA: MiaB/RimO family radical SAM methylthiotransferase [Anaeromyxobacteraceae bacterium]|nr:MiaB/RimO family radical SAM methylthiotransferase [Anaeromyxobacteraceae bacterium]